MPPVPPSTMRVHVVADAAIVRRGLCVILADDGWDVVDDQRAADGDCDVVVWDVPSLSSAGDVSGILDAARGVPVLLLVGGATAADLGALVASGARGAVDRDSDETVLSQAARAVLQGRTFVNSGMRGDHGSARPPVLTRREAQVLELLAEGRTNRGIAEALVISDNTVKNHVRRLYEKLQVRSRTEAVITAARWGMVRIDDDAVRRGAGPAAARR